MGTTKRTTAEKAALARGWLEVRSRRAMTQEEFAHRNGIGVRTLRAYVAEYVPSATPAHQLREILKEALSMIQRIAERLDELEAQPAAVPATHSPVATQTPQQVTPAPPIGVPTGSKNLNEPHERRHRNGFSWDN